MSTGRPSKVLITVSDVDLLDGVDMVDDLDLVAADEWLAEQQQDAGEQVRQDVLEGKTDGHGDQTGAGEQVEPVAPTGTRW